MKATGRLQQCGWVHDGPGESLTYMTLSTILRMHYGVPMFVADLSAVFSPSLVAINIGKYNKDLTGIVVFFEFAMACCLVYDSQ
jgi:hypothetical protein